MKVFEFGVKAFGVWGEMLFEFGAKSFRVWRVGFWSLEELCART